MHPLWPASAYRQGRCPNHRNLRLLAAQFVNCLKLCSQLRKLCDHHCSVLAAGAVCKVLEIPLRVLHVDCRELGSGDMAGGTPSPLAPVPEWWPFRNQLLITFAGAAAISDRIELLLVGSVRTDSSHADGRAEFFEQISRLLALQEGSIKVEAPAINLSSIELVRLARIPFALLAWSHSCHVSPLACGRCRGCTKHALTMLELGYGDY